MVPTTRASRALPVFFGLFGLATPFSIALSHISLTIAVALLILDRPSREHALDLVRHHPLRWPILAWIVVNLMALIFAVHPLESVEKLKKLLLLFLLPIGALPWVRAKLRLILFTLLASATVVSAYGLVHHLIRGGGLGVRVEGIHGFYMTVAGILMVVGLLAISELVSALKDPHRRRIAFLVTASVVIVAALLGTYTRGSWIGFAAGAGWLLRKRWIALVTLALVGVLFYAFGPPDARDRIASIIDPGHPRNIERVLIWTHGLEMIGENPLTGVGQVIPAELMEREIETEHGTFSVHSHMHNAYLQIVVSMGYPALLAFGWLVFSFFRLARRARRGAIRNLWEEGLVAAYPAGLIALLFNGLSEWNFGDSEVLGLLYFLTGCVLGVESGREA